MPRRDGTGRLGKGKNCNAAARADRIGRGSGSGRGRNRRRWKEKMNKVNKEINNIAESEIERVRVKRLVKILLGWRLWKKNGNSTGRKIMWKRGKKGESLMR